MQGDARRIAGERGRKLADDGGSRSASMTIISYSRCTAEARLLICETSCFSQPHISRQTIRFLLKLRPETCLFGSEDKSGENKGSHSGRENPVTCLSDSAISAFLSSATLCFSLVIFERLFTRSMSSNICALFARTDPRGNCEHLPLIFRPARIA